MVDGASVETGASRLSACVAALSGPAATFRSRAGDLSAFGLMGRMAHAQSSVDDAMQSLSTAVEDFGGCLHDAAASMRVFAGELAQTDATLALAAGGS